MPGNRRKQGDRFNSRLREEATAVTGRGEGDPGVSTHASVRRRQLHVLRVHPGGGFNSRLREEATSEAAVGGGADQVSTHASVRRRQ